MDATGRPGGTGDVSEERSLQITGGNGPRGDLLIHFVGEIDLATAPAFRAGLNAALDDTAGGVVLDLSRVTFMDSAGIEELVRAREQAGRRLRVGALHPAVKRVLEMTALLEWFAFEPDCPHEDRGTDAP